MGDHDKRIWKLVAYLGRYGHQPADVSLSLTVNEMRSLAEAINEIVDEEKAEAHHED